MKYTFEILSEYLIGFYKHRHILKISRGLEYEDENQCTSSLFINLMVNE